jgi:hypothetical protein
MIILGVLIRIKVRVILWFWDFIASNFDYKRISSGEMFDNDYQSKYVCIYILMSLENW